MTAWLAALLAALAASGGLPPRVRVACRRRRPARRAAAVPRVGAAVARAVVGPGRGRRSRASCPGRAGWSPGVVSAVVAWVLIGRTEPADVRRRRRAAERDLPGLVQLLAAALETGCDVAEALRLVCDACPGPASDALATVPPRLALGLPPDSAWQPVLDDPQLAPLGRALVRAGRSGASVTHEVARLADELARPVPGHGRGAGPQRRGEGGRPARAVPAPVVRAHRCRPARGRACCSPSTCDASATGHELSTGAAPAAAPPQPAARTLHAAPAGRAQCRRGRTRGHDRDGGDTCTTTTTSAGITTAEYAVGTAAGAGLAGLLFKLLTGGFGEQLLRTLFDHVLVPAGDRVTHDQRGAATAELALAIPLLLSLTIGLVWLLSVGAAQVRMVDAAREAARATARGDPVAEAEARGEQIAPPGSTVAVVSRDGEVVSTATGSVGPPGRSPGLPPGGAPARPGGRCGGVAVSRRAGRARLGERAGGRDGRGAAGRRRCARGGRGDGAGPPRRPGRGRPGGPGGRARARARARRLCSTRAGSPRPTTCA